MARLVVAIIVAVAACGGSDTKLKVTGLDPDHGNADGEQYVRIFGNAFTCDGNCTRTAKVYFGTRRGTVVRFASNTEMIVQAPGGKPDETVDVLITFEPGGELKIPKAFTYKEPPLPPALEPPPKK